MSCDCYSILWFFLTVPWVGLQCVCVTVDDKTEVLLQKAVCQDVSIIAAGLWGHFLI